MFVSQIGVSVQSVISTVGTVGIDVTVVQVIVRLVGHNDTPG